MQSALRPYVTTGIAIAGATLIAAGTVLPAQVAATQADAARVVSMDVDLVASKSVLNVVPNLINAVLSVPMAEVNAINRFSAAMEASKSWWVYSDVNVLGWDPPNEEMTKGFVDMLLPFAPFSGPAGEATFLWFAANFPMNAGCSGLPPCPHPEDILSHMFQVAPWEFYTGDGYTFPEVINPVSENETHWGQELGEDGKPAPWSEHTYLLDPNAGLKAVIDYLLSEPEDVEYPTGKELWDTTVRLTTALWKSWYPFVPQSTLWNPQMSLSAVLFRPFAKVLCPDCNPADPFMPTDWKPGDKVPKGSYVPPKYRDDYDADGNWIGGTPPTTDTTAKTSWLDKLFDKDAKGTVSTEVIGDTAGTDEATDKTADTVKPGLKPNFLAETVQNLTQKFEQAAADRKAEREAAKDADKGVSILPAFGKGDKLGQIGLVDKDADKDADKGIDKDADKGIDKDTEKGTDKVSDETPAKTPVAEKPAKADDSKADSPTKKWSFGGGKHRKADADTSSSDGSSASKTSDKSAKSDKAGSTDKKSGSESGGGKKTAGAHAGGSSNGGGSE